MWRTTKMLVWTFLSGAAAGAYGAYDYAYKPLERAVIDRGYCGDRDNVFGWPHMYDCRDSAIAMDLQAKAIERDQEQAAILADMQKTQPKLVKAKKPK
jgi:hypothetical protein